jgi:hypothetical protein
MTIKEKIMIQENIKRIESGNFGANDVYMVYLELRQHVNNGASPYENIFFELSNFVAHNNTRNQGNISDNFKDFYYVSLYLSNYLITGNGIDLSGTFPAQIKEICLNKLSRMEQKTVKNIFDEDKNIIEQALAKAIVCDNNDTAFINKSAPSVVYKIISNLLDRIPVEPVFTDDDIIKSLLKVLYMNNIKYDKKNLLNQKDKIILSLLVLIHHTEFDVKLGTKIYCHIYYDINTNNLSLSLGYLVPDKEWISFMYEAITTKLNMNDCCTDEFLKKHYINLQAKNGSVFNSELGLTNEFKLEEKIL